MPVLLLLLLMIVPVPAFAGDDIYVPNAFVLQRLVETDGQIARPKDWFYTSASTSSGRIWTLSKEDPAAGPYRTGLLIQLLAGVAVDPGRPREAFPQEFIQGKRTSTEVSARLPKERYWSLLSPVHRGS